MSTNSPLPPQEGFESPFSQEELASFVQVETPEPAAAPAPPAGTYVTPEEMQQLLNQQRSEYRQEVNYIRQELAQRPLTSPTHQETPPSTDVPIRFGTDGKAFVSRDDLEPLITEKAQNLVHERIAPLAPALAKVQMDQSIASAVEYVRQNAPEVLEGQDPNLIGRLSIDFYNSSFNTGADPHQRAQYALDQIKQFAQTRSLPMSTGSNYAAPTQATVPAYNQVGRTPAGPAASNPFGFERGATVNIPAKSINDVGGIEEFQAYASYIDSLHAYNRQHGMGWKIVQK